MLAAWVFQQMTRAPEALVVAAAVLAAIGVIWRKGIVPVRDFIRRFKRWMDRMENAVEWVEAQMKPNGGSSLVDKVNMLLQHDAERDTKGRRYGPAESTPEDK